MNYDTKIIRDNFINIKNSIKKTINNDQIYNDFLKNVLFYGIVDNKIVLLVNNNFLKSTIENNYKDLFIKTFANTINNKSYDWYSSFNFSILSLFLELRAW